MKLIRSALVLLIAALVTAAGPTGPARSAAPVEIAVVVNTENPIGNLSADEIRGYYMKQKTTWPNGEKIRPVDTETDNAARGMFITQILKTTSSDLERHWLEIKYRSAESPPKRMADDEGVIKYVSAFKGGIGFIETSALDKAKDRPIRVVLRVRQ
jgi:ABC-type phosphate transport system substrate-binding protein